MKNKYSVKDILKALKSKDIDSAKIVLDDLLLNKKLYRKDLNTITGNGGWTLLHHVLNSKYKKLFECLVSEYVE